MPSDPIAIPCQLWYTHTMQARPTLSTPAVNSVAMYDNVHGMGMKEPT